jgi:hypothetical protein
LALQATDERYNNKGAYIVLEGPDFSVPHFFEFEAVQPRPKASCTCVFLLETSISKEKLLMILFNEYKNPPVEFDGLVLHHTH